MRRESIYVCTYRAREQEHVAHVRAWDGREAAETFARELELEAVAGEVCAADVRVRPVFERDGSASTSP